MRRGWLVSSAIGCLAISAQGADVQLFGIHTPVTGDWAVYARISNAGSSTPTTGKETVAGFSNLSINVLNNGGNTVTSATNMLPYGTTNTNGPSNPVSGNVGYGFWLLRDAQTLDSTGAHSIQGAQFTDYETDPFNPFVLQGIGLTGGSQLIDVPNHFTSAATWTAPLLVAKGKYTPVATTGAASAVGLTVQKGTNLAANLLQDTDPSAAVHWGGPFGVEAPTNFSVIDPRYFTGGLTGSPFGGTSGTSYKAGLGDADLDGTVGLNDLLKLANHYGQPGTWFDGDFDYDGNVGLNDLLILANNYGTATPGSPVPASSFESDFALVTGSVPEPSSLLILGGLLGMRCLARRKRLVTCE